MVGRCHGNGTTAAPLVFVMDVCKKTTIPPAAPTNTNPKPNPNTNPKPDPITVGLVGPVVFLRTPSIRHVYTG